VVRRLQEKRESVRAESRGSAGTVRSGRSGPSVSRQSPVPSRPSRGGIERIRQATRDRIGERRTAPAGRASWSKTDRTERVHVAGTELRERTMLSPRLDSYARRHGTRVSVRGVDRLSRHYPRPRPHIVYRDRPDLISHRPHHVYSYRDRYDRLCDRIIWPRYHYPVYYRWGSHVRYRWVYPYYHRKYVFVSLGGWWPGNYSYARYHWYGWHPYSWYGYYPVPREVGVGANNYYTYNYYTGDENAASDDVLPYGIDAETLAGVQQRLAQQQTSEPAAQTQADTYFETGVTSFEAGRYHEAAEVFAAAMELSPEDRILPFAYAQALFAGKKYSDAAKVLRMAMQHVSPEEEGVFYPRGLYGDDDTLFGQIEVLLDKAEDYGFDADLQLLLGYHLLGVGETEYARAPLEQAGRDIRNAQAANALLDLLNKMETTGAEGAGSSPQTQSGATGGVKVAPGTTTKAASQSPATSGATKSNVLKRMEATSAGSGAVGAVGNTEIGSAGVGLDSPPAKKEDDGTQAIQNVGSVAPVR
jgi:tetratricopeptide (TPR) repeat protein